MGNALFRLRRRNQLPNDLSRRDTRILREMDNDVLRQRVNDLTLQTGSGRLRGRDGTTLDIGGNQARSLTRRALDGAPETPDTSAYQQ